MFARRFVFFVLLLLPSIATFAESAGKVVFVDGIATADGKALREGDLVSGTVTLRTEKSSSLEVVFDKKNVFRLGASTIARVNLSSLAKTVDLDQGSFSSVLKALAKLTGAGFLLRTPTVAAGVRGTSFHVEVEPGRTYFCTCNGEVALDSANRPEELLVGVHHHARVFTQTESGIVVTDGTLEGHDDASMTALADQIGVKIDWTRADR